MAIKASSQVSVLDVTDAYSVTLTSEAFTFVGNTSGAPSGLSCTTQVIAYCGTKQCSKVTIGTITCPTGISSTITNNGTISPTITFTTTATITSACEATIPVTVDEITINKKFSFAVAKQGNTGAQGEPGVDFSQGKMLYTDPTFAVGTNSIYIYNNLDNGTVTLTREAKSSDNPINDSGYEMVCTNTGVASPGHGGFRFGNSSRANAIFVYRIIAKIPIGKKIAFGTNTIGSESSIKWLTSTDGTGKFTEYILKVECGGTGTFSTTGCFYLNGGDFGTTDAPLKWYVAYATCFDMTETSDVMDLKKTVVDQGSTLDVLNNKIESKVWSTDIATAFNNLEIGGKNLVTYNNIIQFGTGSMDKSHFISSGTIIRSDLSTNGGFRFDSKSCYKPNTNYVLECYMTVLSGTLVNFRLLSGKGIKFISFTVDGVKYGNPLLTNFTEINDILNDKAQHHLIIKYATSATIPEDTGYQYTYFQPNSANATAIEYRVDGFCLRSGDKALGWTPAPEDVDAEIIDINTRYTDIKQTVDEIESIAANVNINNHIPFPYYYCHNNFPSMIFKFDGYEQWKSNGLTWKIYDDGTLEVSGTATANVNYYCSHRDNSDLYVNQGQYTLSGCPEGGSTGSYYMWANYTDSSGKTVFFGNDTGNGVSGNIPEGIKGLGIYITIIKGTAVDGLVFKPMMNYGDRPMPYVEYAKSYQSIYSLARQTADKFSWLVQSGTSATDFTLTDRMAELTAEIISLNGNVKVNGDMLVDGTITANKINIEDLFSKNITATNFNITGGSIQIQTSDTSYSFLDLNAGSVWCHIEPGEFKVSNDNGQYSLMEGHMIKCGDDSGNSTYAGPGILEISGDSNGQKTLMHKSYFGYQDTSGNYIYGGKRGNDIRVELYGNNYDYTNPPIIYIDNGNTATGGNGEWLIISTNAIEINGASISNHIVVWDIPWALGSTFGYMDADWTNSIPKGFKTLSVIPTIIESDDWENNITVFTQSITNTGCRVIVNGTAAINITLRLTIIYTKNP